MIETIIAPAMKRKVHYKFALLGIAVAAIAFSCKKQSQGGKAQQEQTLTSGQVTIFVDNTVQPIIEDAVAVFHNVYDRAFITQVNMPENKIVQLLVKDSAAVAVLSRKLTPEEEARFRKRGIEPEITQFATDAVAFITNKAATDTVIDLEEVIKTLQGKPSKIKTLVFDNPDSSTVQELMKIAKINAMPEGVYSLKTNEEVIKYVHDKVGSVGIIGVNWLLQSPASLSHYVENIQVLGVDNVKIDKGAKKYYKPNQSNIATGSYPLTRKLYVLNYQGKQRLGMGFAIYLGSEEGQRLILKSGLLPVKLPGREISLRNQLELEE